MGVELLHENLDPDPAPASSSSSSVRRPRGRAPEENWPAIYAGTEPLVVVIQNQLKTPFTPTPYPSWSYPYPVLLSSSKPILRCIGEGNGHGTLLEATG